MKKVALLTILALMLIAISLSSCSVTKHPDKSKIVSRDTEYKEWRSKYVMHTIDTDTYIDLLETEVKRLNVYLRAH